MPRSLKKVFLNRVEYRCEVIFNTVQGQLAMKPVSCEGHLTKWITAVIKPTFFFFPVPLNTILFDEIICVEGREMRSYRLKSLGNALFQLKFVVDWVLTTREFKCQKNTTINDIFLTAFALETLAVNLNFVLARVCENKYDKHKIGLP